MRRGRIKDAIFDAMGSRNEMPISELRSIVFSSYSEPELMRRGVYYSGRKSTLSAAYKAGDYVDQQGKAALVALGVSKVVMDIRRKGHYLRFDAEKETVSRVRT